MKHYAYILVASCIPIFIQAEKKHTHTRLEDLILAIIDVARGKDEKENNKPPFPSHTSSLRKCLNSIRVALCMNEIMP